MEPNSAEVVECNGDEGRWRGHRCDGGVILPVLAHLGFGCSGEWRGLGVAGEGRREIISGHRGGHRKVDTSRCVPVIRAAGDEVEQLVVSSSRDA